MTELQLQKNRVLSELKNLCAHCALNQSHMCPIQNIREKVRAIQGVPLIVNNKFQGVLWQNRFN